MAKTLKVKDLIKQYPDYQIFYRGYPNSIPFTNLPVELIGLKGKAFDKVFMELEVKGYKAIASETKEIDITKPLLGKEGKSHTYKGLLNIYLKGAKAQ